MQITKLVVILSALALSSGCGSLSFSKKPQADKIVVSAQKVDALGDVLDVETLAASSHAAQKTSYVMMFKIPLE